MTNKELLLDVLSDVQDEYIEDVTKRISAVKTRRYTAWTSIAAVFVLLCGSLTFMLNQMSVGRAAWSFQADSVNEYKYYEIPDDGIYRYKQGEKPTRIVKIKEDSFYEFIVNEHALYYTTDNKTVYKVPHESDEPQVFFEDADVNWLYIYAHTMNDIKLSLDYYDGIDQLNGYLKIKEVILDGVTGKEKCVTYEYVSYTNFELVDEYLDQNYSDEQAMEKATTDSTYYAKKIIYETRNRTLNAKLNNDNTYALTENGKVLFEFSDNYSLTPEKATSEYVIFKIGEYYDSDGFGSFDYYILRDNGEDSIVTSTEASEVEGDADFLYYIDYDDNLMCVDTKNNETYTLFHQKDLSFKDLFSDGEYICISEYDGNDAPDNYKIIFDENGRPCDLSLVD